jgi:DNA invertase Pin-like site-specific DNA recombinase
LVYRPIFARLRVYHQIARKSLGSRLGGAAELRPGDTLVGWKLDRLGRSLRHLVDTVTGLADRGIGFRSLQEAIDTTTPWGKLVFHVFAALAESERDLIRERTAAGPAAARARGRHGGRPSVMTAHEARVAQEMYRSGQYTVTAIAQTLGVSRASIYRHLIRADSLGRCRQGRQGRQADHICGSGSRRSTRTIPATAAPASSRIRRSPGRASG